jgi:hypothetical protein
MVCFSSVSLVHVFAIMGSFSETVVPSTRPALARVTKALWAPPALCHQCLS